MTRSLDQQGKHDVEQRAKSSWRPVNVLAVAPGIALCALATAGALAVNHWLPAVSPLLIAIVFGAVAANIAPLPQRLRPGLQFSAKRLLRVGVAMLGLQLVLGDIFHLGYGVIVIVVAVVVMGIAGTLFVGKLLGLPGTPGLCARGG